MSFKDDHSRRRYERTERPDGNLEDIEFVESEHGDVFKITHLGHVFPGRTSWSRTLLWIFQGIEKIEVQA